MDHGRTCWHHLTQHNIFQYTFVKGGKEFFFDQTVAESDQMQYFFLGILTAVGASYQLTTAWYFFSTDGKIIKQISACGAQQLCLPLCQQLQKHLAGWVRRFIF